MPNLTVRFYHVHGGPADDDFASLLDRVQSIPLPQRTMVINGYDTRLQNMETTKTGFIIGDVVKIRMRDAPTLADLGGEIDEIPFEETQGAGEHNAFLFHASTGGLLFQTGGGYRGASVSVLMDYLSAISGKHHGKPARFDATQVLHTSTIDSISELSRASRVVYRVATGGSVAMQGIMHGGKDFGEVYTEHVLSVGHASTSLDLDAIMNTFRSIMKKDPGRLLKADVKGHDSEGNQVELHIVDGHSAYHDVVLPPDGKRNIPYKLRKRLLLDAWQDRKEMFGAP